MILEKFFRVSDKVKNDLDNGEIETVGKFGKNELDEHAFIEFANSKIRTDRELRRTIHNFEVEKVDLKSGKLLSLELSGEYDFEENDPADLYGVSLNINEKHGLDDDERERLLQVHKDSFPKDKNGRIIDIDDLQEHEKEVIRRTLKNYQDYKDKKGKPTEREQKLLDDEKK